MFDDTESIAQSLRTYETLQTMLDWRHDAYYNRKIRLREFLILGRLYLDTCGNASALIARDHGDADPDHSWADAHPVLTRDEAMEMLKAKGIDGWAAASGRLPPHFVLCPTCGKGWDLTNFTDSYCSQGSADFPLENYIGRTIRQFRSHIGLRTDALYIGSEIVLRNDKYIDLTLEDPTSKYPYPKNKGGYMRQQFVGHDGKTHGDVDAETHRIEVGDVACMTKLTFKHKGCRARELQEETGHEFFEAFDKAGFKNIAMKEIPNEYGSLSYRGPWYMVETSLGAMKVGWRKRVIELNWSGTGKSYLHLFDHITDTKWEKGIHTYSYEDFTAVLKAILESEKVGV